MKIYAIVDSWEDGYIYIPTGESEDAPLFYATLELAENAKIAFDEVALRTHLEMERSRFERWTRVNEARSILLANNFEGVKDAIRGGEGDFVKYSFTSDSRIITIEVNE